MSQGRGEGRISRRRKRQQAMKVREQAKRAVKVRLSVLAQTLLRSVSGVAWGSRQQRSGRRPSASSR